MDCLLSFTSKITKELYYPEAMYCSPFPLSIARFSTSTAGLFEILSAREERIPVDLAAVQACHISQESAGQPMHD